MVQDQAAHTDLGIGVAEGLKKIPAPPINRRRQARWPRHQIETGHSGSRQRGMDFPAKFPLARSDFHDSSWARDSALQLPHDPSRIAEIKINPPQIHAAPNSTRVIRRQRVQNLRDNHTRQLAHILRIPVGASASQTRELFASGAEGFLAFRKVEPDVAVLRFAEKARTGHARDADVFD